MNAMCAHQPTHIPRAVGVEKILKVQFSQIQ